MISHWQQCIAAKQHFTAEYRLRCVTRGWIWTQAHAAPLLDADGEVYKWVGMNLDITERKMAEEQLIRNERQFNLALDITRMSFWSLDPITELVRMDNRMRSIWGESTSEELIPLDIVLERIHPDDRPLVRESVFAALDPKGSGTYKPTDYRIRLDDGQIRWIAANGTTIFGGRGEDRHAVELFGTVLDITHRKAIEDSLRESEERLQQLNAQLEDRVRDRTRELSESEKRLRATAEMAEQGSRQLRRLALELSRTEERERRRLAQILHDHLQQLLVAAKMRVENLPAYREGTDAHDQLVGIATILDMAINNTRSLAVELVPPVLHTQGLPTALQWLAVQIKDQNRLTVKTIIDSSANPTSEEGRDLLFQTARELLLNVIKHAQVNQAELKLWLDKDQVVLQVRDEGAGFVPAPTLAKSLHLDSSISANASLPWVVS